MSLYDDLGVSKSADAAAVKKAHRKRVRQTHPDTGGDPEEFHKVQTAYLVLSDPDKRDHYDRTGEVDAAPKNEAEQVAMSVLGQVVVQAITGDVDVKFSNLIDLARAQISGTIAGCDSQLRSIENAKVRASEIRGRIRFTGDGPNVMAEMIDAQVQAMERQVHIQNKTKTAMQGALALLKAYEYVHEARAQTAMQSMRYGNMEDMVEAAMRAAMHASRGA